MIGALRKGEYETGRPPLNKVINRVDVVVELSGSSIGRIHQLTDGCHEVIDTAIDVINLGSEVIIRPAVRRAEIDGFHTVVQGVYRVIESFQSIVSGGDLLCGCHDFLHVRDVRDLLVEGIL